jgi:hypothetical protein
LKEIGDSAFSKSGIKSIRIPNNVEKIGNWCFFACESLYEVVFESDSKLKEIPSAKEGDEEEEGDEEGEGEEKKHMRNKKENRRK